LVCISLFFASTGCANGKVQTKIENRLPRDAFVKIIAVAEMTLCVENECDSRKSVAYASGVIVDRDINGSEILTAGHVCDTDDLVEAAGHPDVKIEIKIFALAENGERFLSNIIRIDKTIDSCLMYAPKMTRWKPIRIRHEPLVFGEKLYNLASPLGVATSEFVPFLEGRYSGVVDFNRAAYTIPAAPGSSGSPVFDKRGHLVGMIHSVYLRFPLLSFGPTQDKLLRFLER